MFFSVWMDIMLIMAVLWMALSILSLIRWSSPKMILPVGIATVFSLPSALLRWSIAFNYGKFHSGSFLQFSSFSLVSLMAYGKQIFSDNMVSVVRSRVDFVFGSYTKLCSWFLVCFLEVSAFFSSMLIYIRYIFRVKYCYRFPLAIQVYVLLLLLIPHANGLVKR